MVQHKGDLGSDIHTVQVQDDVVIAPELANGAAGIGDAVHFGEVFDLTFTGCDNAVDRTTNGKGKIHEMTFEQIKELRIIDENGNATEESLPELHDVLELIDGKAHLLLEIKNKNKRVGPLEHAVIDELKRYNALPWVTVQSFGDKTLETIHDIDPNIRLEKLAFFRFMGLPLIFDGGLSFFSFKKYDYIESMNLFHGGASKAFVNKLHKNNIKVRVWTVNELSKTPKADIDGIITDYPDIFIKENL